LGGTGTDTALTFIKRNAAGTFLWFVSFGFKRNEHPQALHLSLPYLTKHYLSLNLLKKQHNLQTKRALKSALSYQD
jgi:hypothetical protein